MTSYSVTVEAFGRLLTTNYDAETRREAEEAALRHVGFRVSSTRQPLQVIDGETVYVGPDDDKS